MLNRILLQNFLTEHNSQAGTLWDRRTKPKPLPLTLMKDVYRAISTGSPKASFGMAGLKNFLKPALPNSQKTQYILHQSAFCFSIWQQINLQFQCPMDFKAFLRVYIYLSQTSSDIRYPFALEP